VNKLSLLKEVVDHSTHVQLQADLLESGLLRHILKWLAPLQDGTLPNIRLRTALYELLDRLVVEQSQLEQAVDTTADGSTTGLGKLLTRLCHSKEETAQNRQKIFALIQKWMRPILGLKTNYKELHEFESERDRAREIVERKNKLGQRPQYPPQLQAKRALIPEPATFDYAYRPASKVDEEESEDKRKTASKRDDSRSRITKKLDNKTKMRRSLSQSQAVSIHGKNVNP